MRFVHTSDWHLGRIFHGVHLTDDQAFAIDRLVELLEKAQPDLLIVAGDIYDRSVPPVDAVKLLDDSLLRIVKGLQIPTVMIAGNHDGPERLSFASRLLDDNGLHLIGACNAIAPIIIEDQHGPVEIHGYPYAEPADVRSAGIDETVKSHNAALQALVNHSLTENNGSRKLALAHAFVTGGTVSDSERTLAVGGAAEVGRECFAPFNYTALGHLHRPQQAGEETVRYSGSLLKYSFSEETDEKGVLIGELDAEGNVSVEFEPITPRHDMRRISGEFEELLIPTGTSQAREDYLEITLTDRGPILDAMDRLRRTYPNLLNIRRQVATAGAGTDLEMVDPRKMDYLDIFRNFYEQVTGEGLAGRDSTVMTEIFNEILKEERNA
jgi:DNA repair protein SbcD/Mre11